MHGGLNKQTQTAVAAAVKTADKTVYMPFPSGAYVQAVTILSDAAQAVHATNGFTVTVTNLEDDAAGAGVVASFTTVSTAIAANIPVNCTLGATKALRTIEAGECLEIAFAEAGTATNDCNFVIAVDYTNL